MATAGVPGANEAGLYPGWYVTQKSERLEPSARAVPRGPFDCTFLDTVAVVLDPDNGIALAGDTSEADSAVITYACEPDWPEIGRESAYRIELSERLQVRALLDLSVVHPHDLDLILLGSCDSDDCLAIANTGLVTVLDPGAYVLMIDGYKMPPPDDNVGWAGPYRVEITGREPGVPESICAPGGAEPVIVDAPDADRTGSLWQQANLLDAFPCGNTLLVGGERWYALRVPGPGVDWTREVVCTVSTISSGLDLALWLFASCGENAECLDFVDAELGGEAEQLTLTQVGADTLTVFLGVDCVVAPASENAGAFQINFENTVATESRSWGDVRSLYR